MFVAACVGVGFLPSGAAGQSADTESAETTVAPVPARALDPAHLGVGPWDRMSALLEVTIFNIDVLTLTVRVDSITGAAIEAAVAGREYSDEVADEVAAIVLEADEMWAMQIFHRDVGHGRLIGGMVESAEKASEAGYVSEAYVESFSAQAPDWFGFLREDGAKEEDMILFHVVGDEVRTVYRTRDGRVLLNEVGEDEEGRIASIPSFFAPGSRFRERLVRSLPLAGG